MRQTLNGSCGQFALIFHLCLRHIHCAVLLLLQITVKLDLKNNNLGELSRGAFILTPYLTHLNLQRCNIIKVKEGAFRGLGRVVSLNLAYNKIDVLYQVGEGNCNTDENDIFHNWKTFWRFYFLSPRSV